MVRIIFVFLMAACDQVGQQNGRINVAPDVAPPRLSRVMLKPATIDPSTVNRVRVVDPPRADSIQVDVMKQSDGIVDILWVIDDSGSMVNERQRLIANFDRFLQELLTLRVSFQMGVTSIVYSDGGRLRGNPKIITNQTADPRRVFENNTRFPASRSRWEQGLKMTELALSSPNIDDKGPNEGFVRANAALAIIVVTNEDDFSFGPTDSYARIFRRLKGKGNENLVSFSVIGGTTPNGCTPPGESGLYGSLAEPAFRYAEVAAKTGGIVGSICDSSFEQTLLRIAQALNTLRRVFPLTLRPTVGTVRVTVVDGMQATVIDDDPVAGYQYRVDSNSVVFLGTYVPPPGSTVKIEYAFSKD